MKNFLYLSLFFALLACGQNDTGAKDELEQLKKENQELKETIELLKYPASDRLISVKKLISENKFNEALKEIEDLQNLFPKSKEASETDDLTTIITEKKEKVEKEEERIKALGFKALKVESSIQVDYNKISIGNFSTAQTFTFDSYDNTYHLYTADRGNKYLSSRISITSTDKDPKLPMFYLYRIKGDKLEYITNFDLRFARWRDYGTYLGNYTDNGNDFSKTATIPFKIGVEVSDEVLKEPLVILLKKENCMTREYDRFGNPPVSYSNSGCETPKTLTIVDINNNYSVINFYNKNKL